MALKFNTNTQNKNFELLKSKVHEIVSNHNFSQSNLSIIIRAIVLILVFLSLMFSYWFCAAASIWYFLLPVFMGVLCVPLILTIGHESIHNNFTSSSKINNIGSNIFYSLGTSPYFWKLRHLNAHHPYTNILEWDMDIEQSKLIRLDKNQEWKSIHRFQAFYMPILFMFYTLNWFFFRDLKDIYKSNFGNKKNVKHPFVKILGLILSKIWHVSFLIFIPYLLGKSWEVVVLGFFLFHFAASLATTLVLVSTHVGIPHELIKYNTANSLPYDWVQHQIRTSGDFSTESSIWLHFFGGFNHHLSHHLFPNVPYFLYPQITPLVKEYCEQAGLPYHHFPNLFSCIQSHFHRLALLSRP